MLNRLLRHSFSHVDVGFKLYYPEGHSKLFQLGSNLTVSEVQQKIFSEEDGRFLQMKLLMGEKDYVNENIRFVEFVVHNPVQLLIDGKSFAYEIDCNGSSNYLFDEHGFEREFASLEDSYIIGKFYTQLMENIHKTNQTVLSHQQLQSCIEETLQKFSQKNQRTSQYWSLYQKVLDQVYDDYLDKEEKLKAVNDEASVEGNRLLRKWIYIALAQYITLLVITYGIYSWNVSEPISYLLAQGLETIGIFYFLRRGFAFRQQVLFQRRFQQVFNTRINSKYNSTNFLREAAFAKTRVHMAHNKLLYGTTSR